MPNKKTLILGASSNPSRYAYIAANRLRQQQQEIVLLGKKDGIVAGEAIITNKANLPDLTDLDTVTVYLSPSRQSEYYDFLLGEINFKRIIFNPGSEYEELMRRTKEKGIETIAACTLVMLSVGIY